MELNLRTTLTVGGLSITIERIGDEVAVLAISGIYRTPLIRAYNLKTAFRLMKGWFILSASWKERLEVDSLERVLFDELGGELMMDTLTFIKYHHSFTLRISGNNSDEWVCRHDQTGKELVYVDCFDDFGKYAYFKEFEATEPVLEI